MTIGLIKKMIGKKYQQLDDKGNYLGCFEPLYACFPKLPRYKLPENREQHIDFSMTRLRKIGKEVEVKNIEKGDVIAFRLPRDIFHIGIYAGEGKMLQTFVNSSMQISRVDFTNPRIIGIYRIIEQ